MTDPGQAVLEIESLRKMYGNREVLKGVSLRVEAGETVALIGGSGSGKSTLLRCAALLERFDEGSISLEGRQISRGGRSLRNNRAEAKLRANFGVVFQQFNLFRHRSALENVMEGPRIVRGLSKAAARDQALTLLERVGLAHRAHAHVPELSGGEQQRVAIARALAMSPRCLLLDEPTSALDPELVAEVLDVIAQLAKSGLTMLLVTHEMGFAYEAADRLVFLSNGEAREEGPAKETLRHPTTPELASFLRRFHYSGLPAA